MKPLRMKIECCYAEKPGDDCDIKEVNITVHSSNIWFELPNGQGFSIDRDIACAILRKIDE